MTRSSFLKTKAEEIISVSVAFPKMITREIKVTPEFRTRDRKCSLRGSKAKIMARRMFQNKFRLPSNHFHFNDAGIFNLEIVD